MTHGDEMSQRIIEVIVRSPNTALDEIVLECPGLTWNQIFLVIDRLSRDEIIHLLPKGRGIYSMRLLSLQEPLVKHHAAA